MHEKNRLVKICAKKMKQQNNTKMPDLTDPVTSGNIV